MSASGVVELDATRSKPVPVTVITGFLGAGKTTLVKHILTQDHGFKIAIILNEFGEEAGIESSFVRQKEGLKSGAGEWVELTNGCMCCSVKNDFVQALEGLLKGPGHKFDYILIETSGLANPGPIASALWCDDELEAGVQLDAVVTVVDALHISRQLGESRRDGSVNEAQLQIAYADLVLLNKVDIAGPEAIKCAEADIKAINSSVHIMRTTSSQLDVGQLLDRRGYHGTAEASLPAIAEDEEEEAERSSGPNPTPSPTLTHSHSRAKSLSKEYGSSGGSREQPKSSGSLGSTGDSSSSHAGSDVDEPPSCCSAAEGAQHQHHGHTHDRDISSVSLRSELPLPLERLKEWIDQLLWDREGREEDIYRMKGVLSIEGSDQKHQLQAVYELYEITAGPCWGEGEARVSRIVIIGRHLRKQHLQGTFAAGFLLQ
ncbi:MAG: hypothetical protein WDW38_003996 [Sanguina aurantia]